MRRLAAALALLSLVCGCSKDAPGSGGHATGPSPRLANAETTRRARPGEEAQPEEYAGPGDAREVLVEGGARPEQVAAWSEDARAPAGVRVASLRRLEESEAARALASARAILADPGADAQVKANAVAVLARSEDPEADRLIARLEPRYRRLAMALRDLQHRRAK